MPSDSLKSDIENLVDEKPEYLDSIKKIVDWENENKRREDHVYIESDRYPATDTYFRYSDVNVNPSKLHHLFNKDVLDMVDNTGGGNFYCLKDREKTEDVIENIESIDGTSGRDHIEFDFENQKLPDDMFSSIVGMDDVKWFAKKVLTAPKRVNLLLTGPPSVAKSVVLHEIEQNVAGAKYAYANRASDAGIAQVLFEDKPKILLLDELEEMENDDYGILEQVGEHGIITETKFGKEREMKIDTRMFAACNDIHSIPNSVRSRFRVLKIPPYDRDEYINVVVNVLTNDEDEDEDIAKEIALFLYDEMDSNDVRDAIGISRMATEPGDVERIVQTMEKYS